MKKKMRMTMCLLLVVLMVATMAVPVMAAPQRGSGQTGQYAFQWSVIREDTYGSAWISTPAAPTYVGAYALNRVYSAEYGVWGYSGSSANGEPNVGYASAYARAGNAFQIGQKSVTGTVLDTSGTFYVDGKLVVSNAVAD